MLDVIKRKFGLLTGLLVGIVLLQTAALAGLGAVAYLADARAGAAMTELAAIRRDLGDTKDASETARDYGRMAAALGPPCPAAPENRSIQRRS
ncbi:hypothetical protein [Terricaulis sp.]|uniref:hypothetical protein n=1 Tax=Terricaulis sp. TaxID=2768686 RepID=UPI003783B34C